MMPILKKQNAKKTNRTILAMLVSSIFVLGGCNSIPQSIEGNNSPILQKSFVSVHSALNLYEGQYVRFGGTVVNVINKDNKTLLEIAVLPLDTNAKHEINKQYEGRIIAKSNTFLDPVNFRNHLVTVLGTLTRSENGTIGKTAYKIVTINIEGYQIWHIIELIQPIAGWDYGFGSYRQPSMWNNGFGQYWGWYGDGTGMVRGWYGDGEGQVITTVTR